ncbi:hypothetical protein [Micromonospora sp. 067-2]|uniref:hypothetical protein n=1 Tax=Micromonospora sp. 067-2 TaxID=2789270 RepID=UPI00397B4885
MLPVALTCPLWWVARWATRVLTSLAVVAALALGAGTSPAGLPTPAAITSGSSAVTAGSSTFTAGPSTFTAGPTTSTCRAVPVDGLVHPAADEGAAGQAGPTRSTDGQATPPGAQAVRAGTEPAHAVDSDRLPRSDGPVSRASRAPPGR